MDIKNLWITAVLDDVGHVGHVGQCWTLLSNMSSLCVFVACTISLSVYKNSIFLTSRVRYKTRESKSVQHVQHVQQMSNIRA